MKSKEEIEREFRFHFEPSYKHYNVDGERFELDATEDVWQFISEIVGERDELLLEKESHEYICLKCGLRQNTNSESEIIF